MDVGKLDLPVSVEKIGDQVKSTWKDGTTLFQPYIGEEKLMNLKWKQRRDAAFMYILARLGESSTWRGLIAVATALGITLNPQQIKVFTAVGFALAGFVGAVFPDAKKTVGDGADPTQTLATPLPPTPPEQPK